jgi:carnosine N-methyltransferase
MSAGDFLEIYCSNEYTDRYHAILTSFFIDTSPNVLEYLEVIYRILRPGGVWINLGPLLYHWEDDKEHANAPDTYRNRPRVELNWDELYQVMQNMGFVIKVGYFHVVQPANSARKLNLMGNCFAVLLIGKIVFNNNLCV